MKYTILDAHIKFFQQNGFIELENLIPRQCLENIQEDYQKSIYTSQNRRDLFRSNENIKKIAFNKTVSSIFKTLTNKRHIRLVYDLLIIKQEKLFDDVFSLNSISSFQKILGGLIINLDNNSFTSNDLDKKNNSIFINSDFPINIDSIFLDANVFLLIVYGELKTIYKYNPKDPYTNFLKKFGYNFGDLLKNDFHPIVY